MKIIALMPVKNEEWILDYSLTCLKPFVDEIIVIDDGSIDETHNILLKHKVKLINKPSNGYENLRKELLKAGRASKGTHFVFLDADEVFTADLCVDFRTILKKMKPGQKIQFNWLAMWKSPFAFRDDGSIWSNLYKDFVFCDDCVSDFEDVSVYIYEPRTPGKNNKNNTLKIKEYGGVMHYQFVPWKKFQIKQAWYRCIELIKFPNTAHIINNKYKITLDTKTVKLSQIQTDWLPNINIPKGIENVTSDWHFNEIKTFFKEYGVDYFEKLDIWYIKDLKKEFFKQKGRYPKNYFFNKHTIYMYFKNVLRNTKNYIDEKNRNI